ncbi:hypothetical protein BJ742DRAFT_742990 [Cladochytrium replicatum]|nr:hypothetical protein BJ742DRAFT_742990 [Cladochytrium replicatum]
MALLPGEKRSSPPRFSTLYPALHHLPAQAAPIARPVLEERAPIRNGSAPQTSITQASIDYTKQLLDLDSKIEKFYKGDGKVEPATPYNPYVNVSKGVVAEIIGAGGSAVASSAHDLGSAAAYCDVSAISAWSCATCKSNMYGKPFSIVTADQNDSRFYAGSSNSATGSPTTKFCNFFILDFGQGSLRSSFPHRIPEPLLDHLRYCYRPRGSEPDRKHRLYRSQFGRRIGDARRALDLAQTKYVARPPLPTFAPSPSENPVSAAMRQVSGSLARAGLVSTAESTAMTSFPA